MTNIERKTAQLAAEAAEFHAGITAALNPATLTAQTEMAAYELSGNLEERLVAPLTEALLLTGNATKQRVIARGRDGTVRRVAARLNVIECEAATGCVELRLQAECTDAEVDCPTTIARLMYGRGHVVLMVLPKYSVTGPYEYDLDDIAMATILSSYGMAVLA